MLGPLIFVPPIIIALSIPLILGSVPRNHWYGFRTPKTLSSDTVWYRANRIGGKYLVVTSIIQLLALAIARVIWGDRLTRLAAPYDVLLIVLPLLIAVVLWFIRVRRI